MGDVKRFRVTRFRVHLIQSKTMEFDADGCEHIVHNFGNSYRWTLGDTQVACVTTGNLAGWVTVAPGKDRGPATCPRCLRRYREIGRDIGAAAAADFCTCDTEE